MTQKLPETPIPHHRENSRNPEETDDVKRLIETATQLGASEARGMFSKDIRAVNDFAVLCERPHKCPNFGRSLSCPPHVAGPEGFKQLQALSEYAVVIKIELPVEVLLSDQRWEVSQLLHEIVAAVEQEAIQMGYPDSRAFAGGSCKQIFCREHEVCRVISEQGDCRHPESARPSMSGFGIDVVNMMKSAGCRINNSKDTDSTKKDGMSWIAGLVLLI